MAAVKKKMAADRRTIWGGVSGALTVELGTEDETRAAVRRALDILGEDSGFILSPVDNVRVDTPQAWNNTYALIDAWKNMRKG
jgi:hypothetical protein